MGNTNDLYEILFQQTKEAIFIVNHEGRFLETNQAFLELVDYAKSTLKKKMIADLVPDTAQLETLLAKLLEADTVKDFPMRIRRKDGTNLDAIHNVTIQKDEDGRVQTCMGMVRDVTRRKKAELDLQLTQFTVDRAGDNVFWMRPDASFYYVNDQTCLTHGYTREELLNLTIHDLQADPISPEVWPAHWEEVKERKSFVFTTEHRRKNGELFPFEVTVNYISFGDQEFNCAFGRDISERKKIEAETIQRQEALEALNQLSQDISAELDPVSVLQTVARRVVEFFDVTSAYISDFNEEKGTEIVLADYYGPAASAAERVSDLGKEYALEDFDARLEELKESAYFLYHHDDPDLTDFDAKHLEEYGGKTVLEIPLIARGRLVGMIDIWESRARRQYTENDIEMALTIGRQVALAIDNARLFAQAKAEIAERKLTEAAMRQSEQRLSHLVQQSPLAIIEWNLNFEVREWNLAAEQMFGHSRQEAMGQPARFIIPAENHEQIDAIWEGLLSHNEGSRSTNYNITADGRVITCEWFNTPLLNEAEEVIGVASLVQDISERERLTKQVEESLARREREVTLSTQIAQEIASATDLSDLYQRVVTQIQEQFGYYHTQLLRYDPAMDTVALTVGYGEVGQEMLSLNHSVPVGVGIIGKVAATGNSILRPRLTDDPHWQHNPLLPEAKGELAVPIKLGKDILGVLDVQSDKADALNENDQLILEGLCGQIAVAIDSTTLRQDMEVRLRELNALQRQMSREGWEEYMTTKDRVSGYHFDHAGTRALPLEVVPETNGQQKNGQKKEGTAATIQSVTSPLQIRGETFGFLGLQEDPDRPLTPEDEEFLTAVSQEVAEALEAARLFEQTQDALAEQERLTSELETVAQVSTAASTILEVDALLQAVVDLSKTSFDLYHVHIYLLNETGRILQLKAGAGNVGRLMALEGREINIDAESLVARAARTRQGVLENNVRKTIDFLPHPLLPNTQSEMAIPMILGDKLIGVLDLQSDKLDTFSLEDLKIQRTLASQISIAVENARQYAEQVETSTKLRELDQLKSEFLASMSHELRTPLNSIIGFADVLLEGLDGDLNERMEEDVRLIRESGRHLRELIGDILDMSKIEAGRMDLRYEEIDLQQMANDIMASAQPLAQAKNLDLYLDLDDSILSIQADRTRLRQVLINIMGNAIKFTDQGSISLSLQDKNSHVLFAIRDTGVGIKEENLPVVFEQFRQIDGGLNRSVGGTGLGMPITKKLVEIHGGDIWVESVYGQGSTFFFTIPYVPPHKEDTASLPDIG